MVSIPLVLKIHNITYEIKKETIEIDSIIHEEIKSNYFLEIHAYRKCDGYVWTNFTID